MSMSMSEQVPCTVAVEDGAGFVRAAKFAAAFASKDEPLNQVFLTVGDGLYAGTDADGRTSWDGVGVSFMGTDRWRLGITRVQAEVPTGMAPVTVALPAKELVVALRMLGSKVSGPVTLTIAERSLLVEGSGGSFTWQATPRTTPPQYQLVIAQAEEEQAPGPRVTFNPMLLGDALKAMGPFGVVAMHPRGLKATRIAAVDGSALALVMPTRVSK